MNDIIYSTHLLSDADSSFTRYVWPAAPANTVLVLEAAEILVSATATADGTNYGELVLKQASTAISLIKGTNSGQSADATHEAGATLTAGTRSGFTLTGVGKQLEFSQSQALSLVGSKGGSGVAIDGELSCRWRVRRPTA